MDSLHREIIKSNKKVFDILDYLKLEPFLSDSKIFTKSMLKDIYDSSSNISLYSELPTRGPTAFTKFLSVLEKAGYKREANLLKKPQNDTISNYELDYPIKCKLSQEYYSMKSKPLGYCFIINNVKFNDPKEFEERDGSNIDVKNLRKFFENIDYTVDDRTDLNGKKMLMDLEKFSRNDCLKSMSCCFIVISSHGTVINNLDAIYGTDGVVAFKNDILNLFSNANCEYLRNKPKIFIFQACRGVNDDDGVYYRISSDSSKMQKKPSFTDMLVIHSSLPYHKAYRDHDYGSWLIQDLISVMSEWYLHEDIDSMLKRVDKKVQARVSKYNTKQVLHIERLGFRANFHICNNDKFKGLNENQITYLDDV